MMLSADLFEAAATDLIQRRQAEAAHAALVAEARRYRAARPAVKVPAAVALDRVRSFAPAPLLRRRLAATRLRTADALRALACRLDPTVACAGDAGLVLFTRRS